MKILTNISNILYKKWQTNLMKIVNYVSVDDIENDTMQSAWDRVAPSIAQDDAIMSSEGCSTLQQHSYEPGTHGITIWNKGSLIKTI